MVLDELSGKIKAGTWVDKFKGLFSSGSVDGRKLCLLKPTTYMNLSGQSASMAAGFFKIAIADIIVVHDDLDLPFGPVRVKQGGGAGGHKGVTSVLEQLGDPGFVRVRMGIGRPPAYEGTSESGATDFVLGDFSAEEMGSLGDVVTCGAEAVIHAALHGAASAMNAFNRRGAGSSDKADGG
jgi:PTH1 family peptidyl-tRNA hydrolase